MSNRYKWSVQNLQQIQQIQLIQTSTKHNKYNKKYKAVNTNTINNNLVKDKRRIPKTGEFAISFQ